MNDPQLAPALRDYLRSSLGDAQLDFIEPPAVVAGGFETSIYTFRLLGGPLAGPLILRVFRSHEDPARALFEKAIQNTITDGGYPAPRIHFACTDTAILGGAFVIMDRLDGRPLLSDFLSFGTAIRLRTRMFGFVSKALADLQLRLHALDPATLQHALAAEGIPETASPGAISQRLATFPGQLEQLDYRLTNAKLDGLHPGLDWLRANTPTGECEVICHGDFHPLNVLSRRGTVTGVIDWSLATIAPAAFDVGNSLMLLHLAPSGAPEGLRKATVRRYLTAYEKSRPLDEKQIAYFEAYRCLRSLAWAGESRQAAAGVIENRGDNPWHPPAVADRLIKRFAELSSVAVALPGV